MKIEVSDITEPKYKLCLELSNEEVMRLQAVVGSVALDSDKANMFYDIYGKLEKITKTNCGNLISGVLRFK
jgi:hypothetical protein